MGFSQNTIRMRLQLGWDLERAFTAPLGSRGERPEYLKSLLLPGNGDLIKYDGLTLTEIATGNGWTINVIRERLRRGWDLERACTEPLAEVQYRQRTILFNGKTMGEAAREKGWSECTIRARIRAGWSVERAFTEPLVQEPVRGAPRKARQNVTFNGLTVAEASRKNGWSVEAIRGRLRRGWPVEKAFTEPLQESEVPKRGRRVQRSPRYDDKTMRQTERENGWSLGLISRRLSAGWSVQRAFTEPQQEEIRFAGLTIAEAASKNGLSEITIRSRLREGWSLERAFTQLPHPRRRRMPSGVQPPDDACLDRPPAAAEWNRH
jgi:lambda repressor-like predicted transcriptional regulator